MPVPGKTKARKKSLRIALDTEQFDKRGRRYKRNGRSNPNWKGGLSQLSSAGGILNLSESVRQGLTQRLKNSMQIDHLSRCWVWQGSIFKSNGRACLNLGRRFLAYRLMFVLEYGVDIDGLILIHSCDNVLCINPEHLTVGTNAENSTDMVQKGRSLKGVKNHAAKLNDAKVKSIRERYLEGSSIASLARFYGVSWTTISYILKRRIWRHL